MSISTFGTLVLLAALAAHAIMTRRWTRHIIKSNDEVLRHLKAAIEALELVDAARPRPPNWLQTARDLRDE